jgi:hypothetical protein
MTARKPAKRAARPKTTAVPDRSPNVPLGIEAQVLAQLLCNAGAEPGLVPIDLMDDAAKKQWQETRKSPAPVLPLWVIDLAAAILATIPRRKITRKGRPLGRAVAETEAFAPFSSVMEAARLVAPYRLAENLARLAEYLAKSQNDSITEGEIAARFKEIVKAHADEIEDEARRLAQQVYRRRKRDMTE